MRAQRLLTVPMVLVSAALFMGALVPNLFVLAPRFLAGIGHDQQQIGVVMGSFNIAMLIATPAVGRLIERFGHRPVLVCGCIVGALGCIAFDQASATTSYALSRAVQGAGFAAVLVGGASYVAEIAPPGRLAQALGISGVLTLCSQAAGPFLGEVLEHAAGWRAVFFAGAGGGCAGALLAAFLPAAGLREQAGGNGVVSARSVLAAILLVGFGFGSVWTFLSDYAERVGVGAVTPFFAPYVIAAIATRVFFGHLPDVVGRRAVSVPALFGQALALLLMAGLAARWHLIAIGALFGLAHGLYYPTLQAMVVERSRVARSRAIAGASLCFGMGIMLSAFCLGALAKAFDYPVIYCVAAATSALAAIAVWTRS